jgi:hypothetical protein
LVRNIQAADRALRGRVTGTPVALLPNEEVSVMLTARFNDGTALRFEVVHGDRFEPHEGEKLLFEFPDGALREGVVYLRPAWAEGGYEPLRRGVYDRKARIVALEA